MTRRHPPKEIDWNVVITLPEDTFREARGMLSRWVGSRVPATTTCSSCRWRSRAFFLLTSPRQLPKRRVFSTLSRMLCRCRRASNSTAARPSNAKRVPSRWAGSVIWRAGASMSGLHRRGFKGIISTQPEERFLDEALLAALPTPAPQDGSASPIRTGLSRSRPSINAPACRFGHAKICSDTRFSASIERATPVLDLDQ